MNARSTVAICVLTASAVFSGGCASTMTPGEKAALFGTLAGVGGAALGLRTEKAIALGAGVAALTYFAAKYEATQQQRAEVQAKARVAVAQIKSAPVAPAAPTVGQPAAPAAKPAVSQPRYIAVDAPRDERSKGVKSVMLYDVQEDAIVGNTVYDLKEQPKSGALAKFDNIEAVYAGS